MTTCSLPIRVQGRWVRFWEKVDYEKPNCNLVTGGKEEGKSALCEALATHYSEQDPKSKILDFWGSHDNEGLSWCRSPYKDSILLLTGDSVKIHSRWPSVKISDFRLENMKKYKVIITVASFYSTDLERNRAVTATMKELWKRMEQGWDNVWCLIIREMANLIYSRLSIGEDQYEAKAYLINVFREMRHGGYGLIGDSIKFTSVDSDVRALADYTYLKACGKEGLPKDLKWVYMEFKPFSITRMPINRFIIISKKASIGRGTFDCPPWHKNEHENILKALDIRIEHTEEPDLDTRGGRLNDREHVDVVKKRFTGQDGKPLSFAKLAVKSGRSQSTVFNAVNYHNDQIDQHGFCDKCKRMNGPLQAVKV